MLNQPWNDAMRAKIGRPARPAVVGAAAAPVRGYGRQLVDSGAYELLQLSLQVGTNAKKLCANKDGKSMHFYWIKVIRPDMPLPCP